MKWKKEEKEENDEVEEGRKGKQILCLPYVKGLSERIERECRTIGPQKLKLAFQANRMIRVKNRIPPEKKKGVVYEIQATFTRRHFHLKTHIFLGVCTSRSHSNSENVCVIVFILKTYLKAETFENAQTETAIYLL